MADFLHGMVGGVCDFAALVTIFWLPVLRCLAQLLPKLLKGSICAAAECCSRRGFERFGCAFLQQPFFFDLPHYDACSTRSDILVVINWYSLPLRGKWSTNGTIVLPHLRSPCPKSTPEIYES